MISGGGGNCRWGKKWKISSRGEKSKSWKEKRELYWLGEQAWNEIFEGINSKFFALASASFIPGQNWSQKGEGVIEIYTPGYL